MNHKIDPNALDDALFHFQTLLINEGLGLLEECNPPLKKGNGATLTPELAKHLIDESTRVIQQLRELEGSANLFFDNVVKTAGVAQSLMSAIGLAKSPDTSALPMDVSLEEYSGRNSTPSFPSGLDNGTVHRHNTFKHLVRVFILFFFFFFSYFHFLCLSTFSFLGPWF